MLPFPNQLVAGIGITVFVLSLCAGVKALALYVVVQRTGKRKKSCSK